jgi:toxin ParE1/3/4
MRTRKVTLSPEAEGDLENLYDYLADHASPRTAGAFVSRIEQFCRSLRHAAERGADHSTIRHGWRSVGFEGRVTIVFHVDERTATILRVFPAGRNWTEELWRSDGPAD